MDAHDHVAPTAHREQGDDARSGWPVFLFAAAAVFALAMATVVTVEEPGTVLASSDVGLDSNAVVEPDAVLEGDPVVESPNAEPELAPDVDAGGGGERLPLPVIALPSLTLPEMRASAPTPDVPITTAPPTTGSSPTTSSTSTTAPATTTSPTTTLPATGAPVTTTTEAPAIISTTTEAGRTQAAATPTPDPRAPAADRTTPPQGVLPQPISVPGGPVQFGFNVDLWGADRANYWNTLEAVPGNGRLIAHEFKSFTKEINTELYQWHLSQGRDLLLTWNGTNAASILDGTHDAWIREHARQLGSLSDTIMLRFWHEPDVAYKADWIGGDPQNFIDSWMYVRQIFLEEGTTNIEWVWCPTAWNWEQQGARFYPGDANVDWICADGYSGMNLNRPLEPIANEFAAFQAWADQRPDKPIIIAEFGATARGPGERAAWVRGIPDWVQASPNIRAVVYFDFDKRDEQPWDWRLRTEPDAWNAVLDVLSSAPFGN